MNDIWKAGITEFSGTQIVQEAVSELASNGDLMLKDNLVRFSCETAKGSGSVTYTVSFEAVRADLPEGRFFLSAELDGWRKDWFVFMPSACYDGNRFLFTKSTSYPPPTLEFFQEGDLLHPEIRMREITSLDNGFNRRITDASAPVVGIFMPERKETFFLAMEQETVLGTNGVEMAITPAGNLKIILSLPCVRRKSFTGMPKTDTAPAVHTGCRLSLRFRTYTFSTSDFPEFYRQYAQICDQFPEQGSLRPCRSFSRTEEILRKMFEEVRWLDDCKFYTKARGQRKLNLGWVAGMELQPLYAEGGPSVRQHVMDELDTIFRHAPLSSGFFLSTAIDENGSINWKADNFPVKTEEGSSITRLQAEILYYLLKLVIFIKEKGRKIPAEWEAHLFRLANALAGVWKKYHQFGFILNLRSGTILIGGSFSGALTPAALMLAGQFFSHEGFRSIAEDAAKQYCRELERKGFTYGGAGDAMFAPDSESAYSLLESAVFLYETTRDPRWLKEAEFIADYCKSWTPSIEYRFAEGSAFDRFHIDCRGAVQANLQNQHGAPAPCIGSANALLRLYRFTGEKRYLKTLQEITHNCVQYLSTEDRPIPISTGKLLPAGDICEKVFFQDYGGIPGNIAIGSGGWTEIADLLCITENPGIYVCRKKEICVVLDHVDASLSGGKLVMRNLFDYAVKIRILADDGEYDPGLFPFLKYRIAELGPRESVTMDLP